MTDELAQPLQESADMLIEQIEEANNETDEKADDDTVTLRGLSDEALEYVLNTYDVELVE